MSYACERHLAPKGDILLDAGSGPVQWPEYLTYSENYHYRLCADISITALKEARTRLGDKGLFVVADIANLPFKPECFRRRCFHAHDPSFTIE